MKVCVVVTRFKEPWEHVVMLYNLMVQTHRSFHMIIYNRGDDAAGAFAEACPESTVIPTENVGRESYVIVKYITDHYHELPDVIFYCPASWATHEQKRASVQITLGCLDKVPYAPFNQHDWNAIYNTGVASWHGTCDYNKTETMKQPYTRAPVRPFGAWYNSRIAEPVGRPWSGCITHFGIFCVVRERVLRYPKEQYNEWLDEIVNGGVNSEVGHFFEYSWASLFV